MNHLHATTDPTPAPPLRPIPTFTRNRGEALSRVAQSQPKLAWVLTRARIWPKSLHEISDQASITLTPQRVRDIAPPVPNLA